MEIMEAIASRQGLGLSVIIITKNEAARIAECLASVRFADEIIVLDGFSIDGTADIARAHGAQVHQVADWPGFGPQKNRVLALATQPWVLGGNHTNLGAARIRWLSNRASIRILR
jgi:glycosyltransferase involved in cell wall biosynthesis